MEPKTLSEELQSLVDPKPDEDIENEYDDGATLAARINDVELDDKIENSVSKIRRKQVHKLSSFGSRYAGKKINRQEFVESFEDSDQNLAEEIDDDNENDDQDEEESDANQEIEIDSEVFLEKDGQTTKFSTNENADLNIANDYDDQLKIKAISVKNQLAIYENLLGIRIKMQKMLHFSNRLPSQTNYSLIKNDQNQAILSQSLKGLKKLKNTLLEIGNYIQKENDDSSSRKRKIIRCDESVLSERFDSLKESYPEILDEWYEKTKFVNPNLKLKRFKSFDVKPSKTIEKILMDKERLINRTRIKRSQYDVIGENDSNIDDSNEQIYDDDDFYHTLLQQIIEDKSGGSEDSKKFAEIQRLRGKSNKNVDTRASKGRKLRYDVHEKLVNFMAPIDKTTMTDEAKNDLFKSLFGNFHL